jgi:cytochrome c551/c552
MNYIHIEPNFYLDQVSKLNLTNKAFACQSMSRQKEGRTMQSKLVVFLILITLVLFISACSGATTPPPIAPSAVTEAPVPTEFSTSTAVIPTLPPTEMGETPETEPVEILRPFSPAQGGSLVSASNDWFAAAGLCVICHQNNVDEAGNDVSNGEFWRSTMMANAARDPYYLAGVSIEVERYPEFGGVIESKCNTCHMPMAHFSNSALGEEGLIFGEDGYLNPQHPLHTLALDGVSCTSCHQIQAEGLGDFSSFNGGMVFDMQSLPGQRALFGPFIPQRSGINIMSRSSGFVPQQGAHLVQSEMCATCHNLYTNYITEDGELSEDLFPEQTPYSEWLNSDYAVQSTCQDCHMPSAEGAVALSNMGPAIMRSPYAKHDFVGGNVYMLEVFKNFGGELGVQAGTDHFDATIARTMTQLQTQSAALEIYDPVKTDETLNFDVIVDVKTGHKFPTSYPSRHAWLHVTVKDANGQVIFESGAVSQNGAISGNDNDVDPLAYEPHYDEISNPEQVQIYEPIMHDVFGNVTTELLLAASYVKDNRLLPVGFDKDTVPDDIAPQGAARLDDDFVSGTDTVTYRIDTGDAEGPFTIEVELLYHSISYRWALNISAYETEHAQLFSAYYNAIPNLPVIVAAQSAESK